MTYSYDQPWLIEENNFNYSPVGAKVYSAFWSRLKQFKNARAHDKCVHFQILHSQCVYKTK